jgi:hypothetical protein
MTHFILSQFWHNYHVHGMGASQETILNHKPWGFPTIALNWEVIFNLKNYIPFLIQSP